MFLVQPKLCIYLALLKLLSGRDLTYPKRRLWARVNKALDRPGKAKP